MEPYVYKRNRQGVHLINIAKSWEKLMLAARVIAAVKEPEDVLVRYALFKIRPLAAELSLKGQCSSLQLTPRSSTPLASGHQEL